MSLDARPPRRYDTTRRREQATRTRRRVVEAAARVFLDKGYAGATIPAIASEAGVAVETVYRAAPGKAGLLAAAVHAAVAGGVDRSERPVEERAGIRRVIDATDPRRRLDAYAATQPGVWSRVGPIMRVLTAAAGSDVELRALQAHLEEERLSGLRRFATLLAERGELRPGMTVDEAAEVIWTLCAQPTYDALVTSRGWSHGRYQDWLADMLVAALHPRSGNAAVR